MAGDTEVKWRNELVQHGALYWSNMVTGDNLYITKEEFAETVKTKKGKPRVKKIIKWRVCGTRPSDGQRCYQFFDTLVKAQKYAEKCAVFINDYYKQKKEMIKCSE